MLDACLLIVGTGTATTSSTETSVCSVGQMHFMRCSTIHHFTGTWSKEEEDKLTQIVTDMTVNQGKNLDGDVFWGRVSELMGGTRGRQQCRIKW